MERLTGALLDRLTHHVHILEMNGESYRLTLSRVPSSRRSRGRIGRTVNAVSTCSFNFPTPTNLLPSVITSVVHDHTAPVAQYLSANDTRLVNIILVDIAEDIAIIYTTEDIGRDIPRNHECSGRGIEGKEKFTGTSTGIIARSNPDSRMIHPQSSPTSSPTVLNRWS